jgi:acyl carrier protein
MAAILGLEEDEIEDDTSPNTVESWDSLKHMNLILALEEEFDVEFSDDQVVELTSYREIRETLAELV